MTLTQKLNENVTWQQMAIVIGFFTFVIGLVVADVSRLDNKVEATVVDDNKVIREIAGDIASIKTSNADMKIKVEEMYREFQKNSAKGSSSEITISNNN